MSEHDGDEQTGRRSTRRLRRRGLRVPVDEVPREEPVSPAPAPPSRRPVVPASAGRTSPGSIPPPPPPPRSVPPSARSWSPSSPPTRPSSPPPRASAPQAKQVVEGDGFAAPAPNSVPPPPAREQRRSSAPPARSYTRSASATNKGGVQTAGAVVVAGAVRVASVVRVDQGDARAGRASYAHGVRGVRPPPEPPSESLEVEVYDSLEAEVPLSEPPVAVEAHEPEIEVEEHVDEDHEPEIEIDEEHGEAEVDSASGAATEEDDEEPDIEVDEDGEDDEDDEPAIEVASDAEVGEGSETPEVVVEAPERAPAGQPEGETESAAADEDHDEPDIEVEEPDEDEEDEPDIEIAAASDADLEEAQAAAAGEALPPSPPPVRSAPPPPPPPGSPGAAAVEAPVPPPPPPPSETPALASAPSQAEAPLADAADRKRRRPWWEDFFNDDYLRTVRPPTEREASRQADTIERLLGLRRGATILDVGCGLGLHAVELAARGYLVVGLDLSLPMLSRAADEAQDRGLKINFLHGDMRDMSFDGAFDAVLCWGTTFGYFDDDTNKRVVERLRNALKPGGLLLLDVNNRDFVVPQQPNLVWFEGDGCVCMEETKFNYITSRLEVKRTVILDDGRQRDARYTVRMYSLHELGQILHHRGFRVAQISGHPATPGVFFGGTSPRIIILAERRAVASDRKSQPAPPPAAPKGPPKAPEPPPKPED